MGKQPSGRGHSQEGSASSHLPTQPATSWPFTGDLHSHRGSTGFLPQDCAMGKAYPPAAPLQVGGAAEEHPVQERAKPRPQDTSFFTKSNTSCQHGIRTMVLAGTIRIASHLTCEMGPQSQPHWPTPELMRMETREDSSTLQGRRHTVGQPSIEA